MPPRLRPALFVLAPLACLALLLVVRAESTPYWLWVNVDPSYFYLLNGLSIANFEPSPYFYHPGTTTQMLVALALRLAHPFLSASDLTDAVLSDPEGALGLAGTMQYLLIALAMAWAGIIAWRRFEDPLPVLLVQTAPLLSSVIIRNAYPVKPEATMVVAALILSLLLVHATRGGGLARPRATAISLGAVIGFAIATKLLAVALVLVPVFLLTTWRLRLLFAASVVLSAVIFFAPALPYTGQMIEWFTRMGSHSGAYGEGAKAFLPADYAFNLLKQFGRPLIAVPLLLSGVVLAIRRGDLEAAERPTARALAGLVLAQIATAVVVAKHPISYYLIPAFLLAGPMVAFAMVLGRKRWIRAAGWVILALGLVSQGVSTAGFVSSRLSERGKALAIDMRPFAQCTKVYIDFASEPAYALNLGNEWAGYRYADQLAPRFGDDIYTWSNTKPSPQAWRQGPIDLARIVALRPCTVFRGAWGDAYAAKIARLLPGVELKRCTNGDEHIIGIGTACEPAFARSGAK